MQALLPSQWKDLLLLPADGPDSWLPLSLVSHPLGRPGRSSQPSYLTRQHCHRFCHKIYQSCIHGQLCFSTGSFVGFNATLLD